MSCFEWDVDKNKLNESKHGISFEQAKAAFYDPFRIIVEDTGHSSDKEERWFCLGSVNEAVMTVRFTYRNDKIRIFGAGYWRKGKERYEKENKVRK
ncbi:MAG: BrnT family toxin [Deltaproteobacteria bacterium]|nr:MAG: BrnT family toxin [Deltaproteobacteria bacterium]